MRHDSIIGAIGRTDLVRLNRIPYPGSATVYAKMEVQNPGGSVKDRIGISMIEAAERDGSLKPGMTIVEPTPAIPALLSPWSPLPKDTSASLPCLIRCLLSVAR